MVAVRNLTTDFKGKQLSDVPIDAGLSDKRRRGRFSPADVPRNPVEVRLVMTDERRAMYERMAHEIAEWKAGRGPKPRALYLGPE